jgi:hypothetical protein
MSGLKGAADYIRAICRSTKNRRWSNLFATTINCLMTSENLRRIVL